MVALNKAGEKRPYIEVHYRFHELYIRAAGISI